MLSQLLQIHIYLQVWAQRPSYSSNARLHVIREEFEFKLLQRGDHPKQQGKIQFNLVDVSCKPAKEGSPCAKRRKDEGAARKAAADTYTRRAKRGRTYTRVE